MTCIEFTNQFLAFEHRERLFEISLHQAPCWQLIRISIYNTLGSKLAVFGKAKRQGSIPINFETIRNRLTLLPHWLNLGSAKGSNKYEILVGSHPKLLSGLCPFTGEIVQCSGSNYLNIIMPYEGYYDPILAQSQNNYFPEFPHALHWTSRFLKNRVSCKTSRQISLLAKHLSEVLLKEFSLKLESSAIQCMLEKELLHHLAFNDVFRRLIHKTTPRLVVLAVHYSRRNLALIAAANENNIPVAEMQHCPIGPVQIPYNYLDKPETLVFPNYFLTYGAYWKDSGARLPIPSENIFSVGMPRKEIGKTWTQRNTIVLFISQPIIGSELSKWAQSQLLALNAMGLDVIFKLHPDEFADWRTRYPHLTMSNVTVVTNEVSLAELQSTTKVQIGVYSNVLLDGISQGIPFIIANISGCENIALMTKYRFAQFAKSPEDIPRLIALLKEPDPDEIRAVWADNCQERFAKFLSRISRHPTQDAS